VICTQKPFKWHAPCCCFPRAKPTDNFLWGLKYGALQYVYITPICSVLAIALNVFGLYGDGELQANHGYLYVAIIVNTTQLVALYVLYWLYHVCAKDLAPFRPFSKFLVVKSVVFFTYWQSVSLAIGVRMGLIHETENFSVGEVQVGLQDFLVCIEMFIAAAVHKYTFGFQNYKDGSLLMLMEVRKEMRTAKRILTEAGFTEEPGQTGPEADIKKARDERDHPSAATTISIATGAQPPPLESWKSVDDPKKKENESTFMNAVGITMSAVGKTTTYLHDTGKKVVRDMQKRARIILEAKDVL